MKIAVFGGTFDPVHLGHLGLARAVLHSETVDEVLFLPSYHPPHKAGEGISPFEMRVEMLRLAIAGEPGFQISLMEQERSGKSFTLDTLHLLSAQHPENELFLLIGSDSLRQLHTWSRAHELVARYGILVYPRTGEMAEREELLKHWTSQEADRLLNSVLCHLNYWDYASSEIRALFAAGRAGDAAQFLHPSVWQYLMKTKLYKPRNLED